MIAPTTMNTARLRGGTSNQEWATICWQGWQATGIDQQPRKCGEILIHSSFGSWAYQWGDLGEPFAQWLQDVERNYIAEKFMGSKAYKFDGKKTVRELRRSLIEHRRTGDITKADARAIWDFVEDRDDEMESSGELFVERMFDCMRLADWPPRNGVYGREGPERGASHFLEEPWDRICTSIDDQFAGFWRDLWPVFVEHLTTTKP